MPQGLLPQDVVVLAKLVSYGGSRPPIAQVGADLSLSPSQVFQSLKRLERSRLIDADTGRPLLKAVEEFLLHGVKYAFPARRGEATRGRPTAYAAPPLNASIAAGEDLPPVWPDPAGEVRGVTFEPLHKSASKAAEKDPVALRTAGTLGRVAGRPSTRARACRAGAQRAPQEAAPNGRRVSVSPVSVSVSPLHLSPAQSALPHSP